MRKLKGSRSFLYNKQAFCINCKAIHLSCVFFRPLLPSSLYEYQFFITQQPVDVVLLRNGNKDLIISFNKSISLNYYHRSKGLRADCDQPPLFNVHRRLSTPVVLHVTSIQMAAGTRTRTSANQPARRVKTRRPIDGNA